MPQDESNPITRKCCVFVDAHVHIHDCFDLDRFLAAAIANFRSHADGFDPSNCRFVICLTESYGTNKFQLLAQRAKSAATTGAKKSSAWNVVTSGDPRSVTASHPDHGEIEIVAGRQIVTEEKLEVLALGVLNEWKDGIPAAAVIEAVIGANAVPVLPWGFGKWLGGRRRVVQRLIEQFHDGSLFLGDNSGRSGILPRPPQFDQAEEFGIGVLRGTDPLPFQAEYRKVGSFGFYVDGVTGEDGIWAGLCSRLKEGDVDVHDFGALETPFRFVRNQLAMQLRNRVLSRG